MRKVILAQNVTVDGFFAGPKGELDWPIVDDEFNEYAVNLLNSVINPSIDANPDKTPRFLGALMYSKTPSDMIFCVENVFGRMSILRPY